MKVLMKHPVAALLLAALILLLSPAALAQGMTYIFPYEGFRFTQGDGQTVLTRTNLSQYGALFDSLGTTQDAVLANYIASGTVMEVLPGDGGQIAVSVADAGDFADVLSMSALSGERQEQFAAQFEQSGLYESCALVQTNPVCVRLTSSAMYGSMPVYTLRYATLHLGRLYLLSQSIVGRAPEQQDDELMTDILSRIEWLSALAVPTPTPTPTPPPLFVPTPTPQTGAATVLSASGEMTVSGVPAYTSDAALTVTGFVAPNATVRVSVDENELGRMTAGQDGYFSLGVTLPTAGDMTLKVEANDAQRTFVISYAPPACALRITEPESPVFTGDNVVIRGETEPEATVYIQGKGMNTNVKANRNGAFTMRVFMREAETLTFTLRAHLRGLADTSVDITLTRVLTEREAIAEFRNGVISVSYAQLASNPQAYIGKKFTFRGRVAAFADYDGTPCALVLTNNVSTGVWRDPIWVVLTGSEAVAEGDVLTFYLEGEGTTLSADAQYTQSGQVAQAPVARMAYIVR